MLVINELNWTFCQYINGETRALIHQGGDLNDSGEPMELFFVNVLKGEENDLVSQHTFPSLNEAQDYINRKFAHWKFENQLDQAAKDSGGCGSCVAH